MSRLLNEKQVADQIGMSVHWLRRKRVTGGGIPFLKLGDGKGAVRYEEGAVAEYLTSRLRRSTCDPGPAQAA